MSNPDLMAVLGRIIESAGNPKRIRELAGDAMKIARTERERIAALAADCEAFAEFFRRAERDIRNLEAARDRALGALAANQVELERLRARLAAQPMEVAR